ncbi:HAD hydrolase-like protein [Pseudomonas nunensis]|uniref:HAD hydrolase-like protein n=1 Tax=Pseudomonas nunensis TaxID=2961896 RepID=UPI000AEA8CFF|nr:HAD hydrolase-like protein [Pseudomonas nunensis]
MIEFKVMRLLASLAKPPSSVFMIGDKRDDMVAAQRNAVIPIGDFGAMDPSMN